MLTTETENSTFDNSSNKNDTKTDDDKKTARFTCDLSTDEALQHKEEEKKREEQIEKHVNDPQTYLLEVKQVRDTFNTDAVA